jgi:hypothetical protein
VVVELVELVAQKEHEMGRRGRTHHLRVLQRLVGDTGQAAVTHPALTLEEMAVLAVEVARPTLS